MIELLGLLANLGLLELWHLIYLRLLSGFDMLACWSSQMEYQVRYLTLFLLFSVIDDFEWFWMESLYKNFQLMLEFLKAPFLVLHFAYYTLMTYYTLLCINYALLLSMLMILIFYSKCDQASDLWQQLELASEHESDLQDTVDSCKKLLVDFNAGKTQLVLFDQSDNNGSIEVKMDRSVFEEKSSFKMLGLSFSSKLNWDSYIISVAKTASKKIGALIC